MEKGRAAFPEAPPKKSALPAFALDHAPLLWLSASERYMPSDITAQAANTVPKINRVVVDGVPSKLTLDNLDQLNTLGGKDIWLTSRGGIPAYPEWFRGVAPDSSRKTNDAVTCAIVTVEKGDDVIDVFYFYFHAFNEGNVVVGREFGSHVGDWEHNMIRFKKGVPQAVYFSQHAYGQSFTYKAVEKLDGRPVGYIARGSHAVFATPGAHDHTIPRINLPFGLIIDHCDRGTLWDPTLSTYSYSYDRTTKKFTPYDVAFPVNWLYFLGRWGDDTPADDSPGQQKLFGQRKFTGGPTGPLDKGLDRDKLNGRTWVWISPFLTV